MTTTNPTRKDETMTTITTRTIAEELATDPLQNIRQDARRRGLRWADVHATYMELKAAEQEKRERPNEIRQAAWSMLTTKGCWPFWRHGFAKRFGRQLAKGADYTIVPGYDEIAQQIGWEFPEYAGDQTQTEALWDFLFSPYDKMPDRMTLYEAALEETERQAGRADVNQLTDDVPF